MNCRHFAAAVCVLTVSATATMASPVNLLTNGSFEDGVPGDPQGLINLKKFSTLNGSSGTASWDVYNTLVGWTSTAADAGIEVQTKNTIPLKPFDRDHYIELDSDDDYKSGPFAGTTNSNAIQTVSLTAGQKYLLSFAYSPRTLDPASNGILFAVGPDAADVSNAFMKGNITTGTAGFNLVNLTGATFSSLNPAPTTVGKWSVATLHFVAGATGNADVLFRAEGNADEYGGFIDAVHLAPIPVPAGFALAVTGLGLAAALRRRRSAAI